MRSKLRKGDAKTMNVYFMPGLLGNTRGLLGTTATTDNLRTQGRNGFIPSLEEAQIMDGVMLDSYTMPGAKNEYFRGTDGTDQCYNCDYNAGKTLTHEVGHWMGLWHTFEGDCEEDNGGDQIIDTPAESVLASPGTCAHTVNTCPDKPGFDSSYPPSLGFRNPKLRR